MTYIYSIYLGINISDFAM